MSIRSLPAGAVLGATVLLALALRLMPLLRPGIEWAITPDSDRYVALANGLRSGCGFAMLHGAACASPETLRTPGYPIFLALINNLRLTIGAQALLGTATVLIVGLFALRAWGGRVALLAMAVLAFDIPSIIASASIMSDCLFQFVLTAGVLLQLHVIRRGETDRRATLEIIAAAALLAVALLVRPIALPLVMLAPVPVLALRSISKRRRLALVVAALFLPVCVTAGWTLRNAKVAGIATFSTAGIYNLYYYGAGGALWYKGYGDFRDIQSHLAKEVGATDPYEITADVRHRMMYRSLDILLKNPVAAALMTIRATLWLLLAPDRAGLDSIIQIREARGHFTLAGADALKRLREVESSPGLVVLLGFQFLVICSVWVGVICALIQAPGTRPPYAVMTSLMVLVAIVMLIVAAGPETTARFRVPAMPFLAITGSLGWVRLISRKSGQLNER